MNNDLGILAALMLSPASSAAPVTPDQGFTSLVNLLLNSLGDTSGTADAADTPTSSAASQSTSQDSLLVISQQDSTSSPAALSATPKQIAEALIRSMLEKPVAQFATANQIASNTSTNPAPNLNDGGQTSSSTPTADPVDEAGPVKEIDLKDADPVAVADPSKDLAEFRARGMTTHKKLSRLPDTTIAQTPAPIQVPVAVTSTASNTPVQEASNPVSQNMAPSNLPSVANVVVQASSQALLPTSVRGNTASKPESDASQTDVAFRAILTPQLSKPPSLPVADPAAPTPVTSNPAVHTATFSVMRAADGQATPTPVAAPPDPSPAKSAASSIASDVVDTPVTTSLPSDSTKSNDFDLDKPAAVEQQTIDPKSIEQNSIDQGPANPKIIDQKSKPSASGHNHGNDNSDTPPRSPATPAANPDHSSDFRSAFTPAPEIHPIEQRTGNMTPPAASPSPAEDLRPSETAQPAFVIRSAPAQEISVRIGQVDSAPVDLKVADRAGQLHVDVRTPDPALQVSLRENLGTLTNSLERAGYRTEAFVPEVAAVSRSASLGRMSNQDRGQDSSSSGQDFQQGRNGPGGFSGGRQQQQKRDQRPSWLEELENQQ